MRRQSSHRQDPDRRFDRTSMRRSVYEGLVHRDYLAHCLRWGWVARRVKNGETRVLDLGCGVDAPLYRVLSFNNSGIPAKYLAVDLNPRLAVAMGKYWAEALLGFDAVTRGAELVARGPFDLVACFEVVEHMGVEDGLSLLQVIRDCLARDGVAAVSTPVFNGKAALNHVHEWTVPELAATVASAGLVVDQRWGTFISWPDLKRVAAPEELALAMRLLPYHGYDVVANMFAPLHPDASRNNTWILRRAS